MEKIVQIDNIIPFERRPRGRRKIQVEIIPEVRQPTRLELIGQSIGNRYEQQMDLIRRKSIAGLSHAPYNAWGLPEKALKK